MGLRSIVFCGLVSLPVFAADASLLDALPFRFEANRGQAAPPVQFTARGRGYSIGLTPAGSILSLLDTAAGRSAILETRIAGASPQARMEPAGLQPTRTNYLTGDDPAQWLHDVPSWSRIRYREVYPGIDLVFYGNNRRLEYDFQVAPGADPDHIRLEFSG